MESRERVLQAVRQHEWWHDSNPLQDVADVWRRDREVVLAAVQRDGRALQFAVEELKGDREMVLAAVQCYGSALDYATEALRADREVVQAAVEQHGYALQYATEAFRADPEVVLRAVQRDAEALRYAADDLLEDPSFATQEKRRYHLLKLTMLSGRSTVVATIGYASVEDVLADCRRRLGLADDGSTIELWHGPERVPEDEDVRIWPGIQREGEISEYQLLVRR